MRYIKHFIFALFFIPMASYAAQNDFMIAAQLLSAAKNADIQQVQTLVNNGADINFVDATGLSIVCTALMNNDLRAAQILQMYGADASKCDQQIKKYNSKNKPRNSGGLFSGLSSAQRISLTAAGAAVVVGGLLLLTDVFDSSNNNGSSSSSGDRNDNDTDDKPTNTPTATAVQTIPFGPAMPDAESETQNYTQNLNFYSPSDAGILKDNFALMTNGNPNIVGDGQNYLLIMHGYSPLARGYMGQRTLRMAGNVPALLRNSSGEYLYTFDGSNVQGGRPVNVALITTNGINATPNSSLGYYNQDTATYNLMLFSDMNGNTVNPASNNSIYGKYYNLAINRDTNNDTLSGDTLIEDNTLLTYMDLSGFGTAIHNINASNEDNKLAKIVGGTTGGYSNADYIGFMPNGQLTIFRTGGGIGMVSAETPMTGTYTMSGTTFAIGDTINLFNQTLTIDSISNSTEGNVITMSYTNDNDTPSDTSDDVTQIYNAYIGTDGLLYIASNGDTNIDQAYKIDNGTLIQTKQLGIIDYKNYAALINAAALSKIDTPNLGRSKTSVLANASIVPTMRAKTTEIIDDVLSYSSTEERKIIFADFVKNYYDTSIDGTAYNDAISFFEGLGSLYMPLVIFSTGGTEISLQDYSSYAGGSKIATFENSAPLTFSNLEHLFMSVTPVGLTGNGTESTTSVSSYSPSGKVAISQWSDTRGTTSTDDDIYYRGRICGVAGTGTTGTDPWCFAAAGVSDEMAVSSAAGAAGALMSAFSYMNAKEIFTLLALTADGPFLATASDGTAFTTETLTSYLQSMYLLPSDYQNKIDTQSMDYLTAFKEVFGYGLINLERATTPGKKIYFYDTNTMQIVSSSGTAYWRAATNTTFSPSSVLNLHDATISASFYDKLESVDGQMSMPRIWENKFSFTTTDKHGLYMGDVLGEFKTTKTPSQKTTIGNLEFSMSISERAYYDNMNGLNNLNLNYTSGDWKFGASYQRYLTDGESRFNGMSNPILSLTSNAMVSDTLYQHNNWSFGGRIFSGTITDEGLLENDPTIAAQYMPATLGHVYGAQSFAGWSNNTLSLMSSFGIMHETNTVLGAYSDGLLNIGNGDTKYIDILGKYKFLNTIDLTARATFARTTTDASGMFISDITELDSDAFAIGANIGNFEFGISQPLAIRHGSINYMHTEYDTTETSDGKYELNIIDAHTATIDLQSRIREMRLTGTYRHKFGDFTDGAFGFIYRINPNHTDKFGNESIFMLKMTHRVGI